MLPGVYGSGSASYAREAGGLVGPPIQPFRRKQSILRRIQAGGASTGLFTTGNLPQGAFGNFPGALLSHDDSPTTDSQAPRAECPRAYRGGCFAEGYYWRRAGGDQGSVGGQRRVDGK